MRTNFTSESVSAGHPDKVADAISDAVLDAYLQQDPGARVACEVLCKHDQVVVAGEIDSVAQVDHGAVARQAIADIGYGDPGQVFSAQGVRVTDLVGKQSANIGRGIVARGDLGAGDQGLVFGFATDETPSLMPLPLVCAHGLMAELGRQRAAAAVPWCLPDAKSQVTVAYEGGRPVEVTDVVVSTQHAADFPVEEVQRWLRDVLVPAGLGPWWHPGIRVYANPAGAFVLGGPEADCGLTGRKIIVDTYGGMARHGGGAFSGKDATKVDRSAAYFARYVARTLVTKGLARRAELQICYAIGHAQPVALHVETFGTGDPQAALHWAQTFDYRPEAMIERLALQKPIYSQTTQYGHFGKPGLAWELP